MLRSGYSKLRSAASRSIAPGLTTVLLLALGGCSDQATYIETPAGGESTDTSTLQPQPSDSTTPPASGTESPASEQPNASEQPSGDTSMETEVPEQETSAAPFYVVSTTVSVGDTDQGYLVPLSSLDGPQTFDLSNAIEVSDSTIAGIPGTPYLYVGSSAEPIITRWELSDSGTLVKGPSLSLVNLGLTRASVSSQLMFSPERAYIADDSNHQVVVWNPTAMEIVGTIPLDVAQEGFLDPWMSITVRPDSVLVTVSWQGEYDVDWSKFGEHVTVFAIDPATDTITSTTEDPRCNYLFWGIVAGDGTTYYSPMSYYTPIRSMLGDDSGVDSCALRIPAQATSFDEGFELDLGSLVGGRPAGNLFPVSDSVALIRVWHSELVTPVSSDQSNWSDVINEAGFQWWRWELGSSSATLIPNQAPGASEITDLYRVDNRTFLPRVAADYSTTTLDELDANGEFSSVLTGPGNIWGVVRLR